MSLYQDCKTTVSVEGELSDSFSVKIKVYQESALGPLLFAIAIKGLRAWYLHTFEHPTSGLYFPIGLKLVSFNAP